MNDQTKQAMAMALDALEYLIFADVPSASWIDKTEEAIADLREALAQPQGDWVDLTDEEKNDAYRDALNNRYSDTNFADALINKFKSKNTPQVVPQEPVALETVYETIIDWDKGGKRSRRELARRIAALYTTQPSVEAAYNKGYDEAVKFIEATNYLETNIKSAVEAVIAAIKEKLDELSNIAINEIDDPKVSVKIQLILRSIK